MLITAKFCISSFFQSWRYLVYEAGYARVKADSSKLRRSVYVSGTSCGAQSASYTELISCHIRKTMRIVPVYVWDKLSIADKKDRLVSRSEEPVLRESD